jgi:hypothetical protein
MPSGCARPRTHPSDVWLARGAILVIAGLQLLFVNRNLTFGPRWVAPAVETAMLLPLSVATAWHQRRARTVTDDHHWREITRHGHWIRVLSLVLTVAVMAVNFEALVSVTQALLHGGKGPSGQSLLLDALNIWFTNVVVFALWYWTIDRGGPFARDLGSPSHPDFLFPQMLSEADETPDWTPGFLDYFFVSFTNATAFSPTDTMPLSVRAKMLMALEAFMSLLTVGLVAARAVNILS